MTFYAIKYYLFVFTILFCSTLVLGQQSKADFLKFVLQNAKHDTTRCNILNELYEIANENEAPLYNAQILKLAEKCASTAQTTLLKEFYLEHFAYALNNLSLINQERSDTRKALELNFKSLKIHYLPMKNSLQNNLIG